VERHAAGNRPGERLAAAKPSGHIAAPGEMSSAGRVYDTLPAPWTGRMKVEAPEELRNNRSRYLPFRFLRGRGRQDILHPPPVQSPLTTRNIVAVPRISDGDEKRRRRVYLTMRAA